MPDDLLRFGVEVSHCEQSSRCRQSPAHGPDQKQIVALRERAGSGHNDGNPEGLRNPSRGRVPIEPGRAMVGG